MWYNSIKIIERKVLLKNFNYPSKYIFYISMVKVYSGNENIPQKQWVSIEYEKFAQAANKSEIARGKSLRFDWT